jgi:hypothetical protein
LQVFRFRYIFPPFCTNVISGCRRGRTPERSLRQPSDLTRQWAGSFFCGPWVGPRWGTETVVRAVPDSLSRDSSGRTGFVPRNPLRWSSVAFTVIPASFPIRYQNRSRSPYNSGGRSSQASDVSAGVACPLRRASLGGHLAGTVPGAAKVEEQQRTRIGNGDSRGVQIVARRSPRRGRSDRPKALLTAQA